MKLKVLSLLLVASGMSQAALYTLTTGTSATSNGIGNNAGVAFQNSANATYAGAAVTQFGVFSTEDFSTFTTASQFVSAFTAWSGTGTFAAPGAFGTRGAFTNAAGANNVTGSAFNTKNMFLFVGNASSLATSTEFLVLKTNFTFNAADDSTPTPIVNTITSANSQVLFGGTIADLRTTNADASVTPGFRTAGFTVVPEPSSLLLGAVGALGLLRRRRI